MNKLLATNVQKKNYTTELKFDNTEERTCQIGQFIGIYATQASAPEFGNILKRMDVHRLLEQIAETRQRLFAEGHLNENFNALENFGKRHNMEFFAEESLNYYFGRTAEVLTNVEQELKKVPLDLALVLELVNQLNRCCISAGAANVQFKVIEFGNRILYGVERRMGYRNDPQSFQEALQEVMLERERFKNKIELYFKMNVWDPPSVIDDNPGFEDEVADEK